MKTKETYIQKQNRLFYKAMEAIRKEDEAENNRLREHLKTDDVRLGERAVSERYFPWSKQTK